MTQAARTETAPTTTQQREPSSSVSGSAAVSKGAVQLKRDLTGKPFAEQEAMLAPGAGDAPVQMEGDGNAAPPVAEATAAPGVAPAAKEGATEDATKPTTDPTVDRATELKLALIDKLPATLMGAFQAGRVRPAVEALTPGDYNTLKAAITAAGSDDERGVLFKALAAGNTLGDITWLAGKIKGHDATWLVNMTTLGDANQTGNGVHQQWSMSCNASATMVLRGNYDPVFSMKLREANENVNEDGQGGATKNADLAASEKSMLESPTGGAGGHKGVAKPIGSAGGVGRWAEDLINGQSKATGFETSNKKDPSGAEALTIIDTNVAKGIQVPCVIGNSKGAYTHYVLAMHKQVKDGVTEYEFHNTWDGKTTWQTDAAIKGGSLTLALGKMITAIEVPTTQ